MDTIAIIRNGHAVHGRSTCDSDRKGVSMYDGFFWLIRFAGLFVGMMVVVAASTWFDFEFAIDCLGMSMEWFWFSNWDEKW